MKIREALNIGIELLTRSNIDQAQSEVRILLGHVLQKDKLYLHLHLGEILADEEYSLYLSLVEKRSKHMPVAYITQQKEFMSLPFYVDERVLIPRGDTEILVEEAIRFAKEKTEKLDVLDLCCGSGCIGLSFAHYIKNAEVFLSDISLDALQVAEKNADSLQLRDRVKFLCSDLFSQVPAQKFDMILSNPPYISTRDLQDLDSDVKDYEPKNALSGGEDGTEFYTKIAAEAKNYLKKGAVILFEIGYDQGEKVKNILIQNEYSNIVILKDYSDLDRVIKADYFSN